MPQDPFDRVFYMEDVRDPSLVVGRTRDRRRYEQFIRDPLWMRRYAFSLSMMRIAKAVYARERFAVVYANPLVRSVVQAMQEHGVIAGFRDLGNKEMFTVELKFWNDMPVVGAIRVYTDHETARFWDRAWCKKWLQRYDVVDDDRLFLFQTMDGEIIDQKQFLRSNVKYARVLMCVVPPQRNESIYGHHETRPTFRHNK